MFFQKKIDRAMKASRERQAKANGGNPEAPERQTEEEILPSMEELRAQAQEELKNEPVSGKEIAAMILSAFLTIFPVCVAVLLLLCAAVYFLFIR